ncbi:LacI family DNA-binding transcriptional regulator [Paractinoplanes lichenicola]|uniref:LacI family DNA-binding transcriptional regulator n=1 Tax=Paractinoplanes lichenicola TaxID=2802976 RepID=A0ABS1VEK1_9ACTN|nr:LacI family DNA-binding transcriptional regulator [Actinoplanes lichenicola]MBL7253117.1 LacI family DNA-binding transcriptional regulator [Actinoplanes lichenicola]
MATIRDVARLAKVSAGTVSRVLNHSDNVNEDLRRRVRAAAAELAYTPPARGDSTVVSTIGFLLASAYLPAQDDLMNPFWRQVLRGAEREAARCGIRLRYRTLNADTASAGLDAVLLVGSATDELLGAVVGLRIPTVLIDFKSRHYATDSILSDGLDGARVAVEHLLANGHRRIAFVGGPMTSPEAGIQAVPALQHRYLGYRMALAAAGIAFDPALIAPCHLRPDDVTAATGALLSRTTCTAMFCANDQTAAGAIRVLNSAGMRVPQDVSVIGFDDEIAPHTTPPLTTMRVAQAAMGRIGVRRLLARAKNPGEPPFTITLPVDLVERASVVRHRS